LISFVWVVLIFRNSKIFCLIRFLFKYRRVPVLGSRTAKFWGNRNLMVETYNKIIKFLIFQIIKIFNRRFEMSEKPRNCWLWCHFATSIHKQFEYFKGWIAKSYLWLSIFSYKILEASTNSGKLAIWTTKFSVVLLNIEKGG